MGIDINKVAACALVKHPYKELYLAVSRKDNSEDFGLPGGKWDKAIDCRSYVNTAERETLEETGYYIRTSTKSFFCDFEGDYLVITFWATIDDRRDFKATEIASEETGEVKWLPASELVKGSFGDYNRKMFDFFGIDYQ